MGGGHPQNRLIYHLVLTLILTLKGPYHFEGVCVRTIPPLNTLQSIHVYVQDNVCLVLCIGYKAHG